MMKNIFGVHSSRQNAKKQPAEHFVAADQSDYQSGQLENFAQMDLSAESESSNLPTVKEMEAEAPLMRKKSKKHGFLSSYVALVISPLEVIQHDLRYI